MGIHKIIQSINKEEINKIAENTTEIEIINILEKEKINEFDFLKLLSPIANKYIEKMAEKAKLVTKQHFGNVIGLYTPMYISNYCSSECVYCGFSKSNKIIRKRLNLEEIEKEARDISKSGLQHILLLTGEAPKLESVDYLVEVTKVLKKYFHHISIEVYAMDEEDYKKLFDAGVDGLTIYQETYDKETYERVHLAGEKKDYNYRLKAPTRGGNAGMRQINIGSLMGLSNPIYDTFATALHAKYLQNKYLASEIAISVPRICEATGDYEIANVIDDLMFVRYIFALRIFMPRVGINMSTRESEKMRNNMIQLGVTKISAGVSTEVGGHTREEESTKQFEISDLRSVEEIIDYLNKKGLQPILKDWEQI